MKDVKRIEIIVKIGFKVKVDRYVLYIIVVNGILILILFKLKFLGDLCVGYSDIIKKVKLVLKYDRGIFDCELKFVKKVIYILYFKNGKK